MLSLGLMVYIAARKIPQITDTVSEDVAGQPTGFWHQIELMLGKLPLDRFDLLISQFLEKNIRKVKLLLARLDNYLTHHLEQFKKIKHRAHRKQQKKFALFEEQGETKNEPIAPVESETKAAPKVVVPLAIPGKMGEQGESDKGVENTK